MLFAEGFSGLQLILLGLSILVAAFVLRRTIVLGRRSKSRDIQAEVTQKMRVAEQAGSSRIRELELRLHDYGREVEGRMQTRIAVLDRLVVDADREIERLRQLLQQSRQTHSDTAMKPGPDIILDAEERSDLADAA